MQFNRDEYAFLSRRGSVPLARRSPRRPVPEWLPGRRPPQSGGARGVQVRAALAGRFAHARALAQSGRGAAEEYRTGVRATRAAFGRGGQDELGRR